ncbi:MAG TPA: hypothetical protein VGQ36_06650 [Thermoanaerobaculia bacterium]|jgi:hypothetical protein|nr:hypothetical protein [Thermoanaerobaculia bacterium]
MTERQYERDVFVNCPLDAEYRPLFEAIVFAIHDCRFAARSALEVTDTSEVRIEKIGNIIASCKLGLHDISRTELDPLTGLPRFNMALELGMFLGAKRYGVGKQKLKNCLVLDRERYRYQKFISDIAGQDIVAHGGDPAQAIRVVRDWLADMQPATLKPRGGAAIVQRYDTFRQDLRGMCLIFGLIVEELTFNEYLLYVESWLSAQVPNPT